MTYRVVLTDQVFPDTDTERSIFSEIDAGLEILEDHSPENIRAQAKDADALLTTYAALDRDTLGALENLKIVSRYGIGVDNIDLVAAKEQGVVVTNVPDYCVEEVADHTIALLLAAWRKVVTGNGAVLSGHWGVGSVRPIRRLRGARLGLVGFGHIGRAVATRAAAFGMGVTTFDPFLSDDALEGTGISRASSLESLLASSDVVSVHTPLNEHTKGMIDGSAVSKMKDGAVLINTARGPIVELEAVVSALRSGKLAGAGLDVFPTEPPEPGSITDAPGLIATPHTAFYSDEAIKESQTKAAQAIVDVLAGREPTYRIV